MSSQMLYRWSGLALLIGSLLGVISSIMDTVLYPGHNTPPQQILSTPFTIDASLFLAWALLLALGLPGLYLRQAARAGVLGLSGFVVLSLGVLLGGVAFAAVQLVIFPYIVQLAPQALGPGSQPPFGAFLLLIVGPVLLLTVGAMLLGIATLRARIFPRWTSILLIAAGIVFLVTIPPLPSPLGDIISLIGNIIFFVALAGFGYQLVGQGKASEATPKLSSPATQADR